MADNTASTALRPPVDYPVTKDDNMVTPSWKNYYNQLWLFFNFSYRANVPVMPPYTNSGRDAIANAVNGMIIYNTDLNEFQGFKNGAWVTFQTV